MADDKTTAAGVVPSLGVSDSEFAEAAASPSSFSVEGLSQSNRSISELIAADAYMRKRARAVRRRHPLAGVGISYVVPPGP